MSTRTVRWWLIVPTLLAALVRLGNLAFLAARDPLFRHPVVDAWFHANQALQIIDKGWLLPGTGAFYKGPLLSYVFAVLFSLFGPDGGVVALRALNVVLGVAVVHLAARIAWRLAGPAAAWIAGLAAALYGTAVYFDASLLQPPLLSLLMLAAGERLLASRHDARPERNLALAGLFLGLLTITRGEGLLAIALAALWALAGARRRFWENMHPVRAAALVAVPALLVVAPVTFRNAVLERDPVAVSWNGGINLFMGNDPAFEQASGNWHPDLAWMRLYDAPRQLGLARGVEHQRFFVRQAVWMMSHHPLRTLGLWVEKAGLLFSGYEIANNQRIYEAREKSPILAVLLWRWGPIALPLGLAAPLLAAGLVLAGRRGAGAAAPLLLLALATAIVPVLFFNTARYRLPAILVLVPAAAAGWGSVHQAGRWTRRAAGAAGVAAALLAAVMSPTHATLPPSDELNLADVAEREGRTDEALNWRRRAVAREPDNPMARIRLADTLRTSDRVAEALEHYEAVAARRDLSADWINAATRSLARCRFALGQYDQAVELFRKYLAAEPDAPWTGGRPDFHLHGTPPLQACTIRLDLSLALERAGRRAEAAAEAGRVLTDCQESEELSRRAQKRLQDLAGVEPSK